MLARGFTNQELAKYIHALKPDHRYFSGGFQHGGNSAGFSDADSDSSYDSGFEEQYAELVKNVPSELAEKIPWPQK